MSLVVVVVVLLITVSVDAFTQSVGVQGQLMCGNSPLPDTEVTLWESYASADGLATTKSDSTGRFSLSASVQSSDFPISTFLRIYPHCNSDQAMLGLNILCQREATYPIPSSFVNLGTTAYNFYQLGTINMQVKQPNEQALCSPSPFNGVNNAYGYITD